MRNDGVPNTVTQKTKGYYLWLLEFRSHNTEEGYQVCLMEEIIQIKVPGQRGTLCHGHF
jgi:hypothetical protein